MEKEKVFLYKSLSILIIVLTFVAVYISLFAGSVADRYSASLQPARTITVSASGKSTVKPDIANLSFSVVSEGKETTKIAEENNTKINKGIDLLKENGIDEKDIRTSEYNLYPVYSQPTPTPLSSISITPFIPKIYGYTLTQTIEVKIRDFSKISPIIDKLPAIGINKIGNVYFSIDDQEKYLSEAREDAYEKIQKKAKDIVSKSNLKLGKITNISEYSNQPYPYYEKSSLGMGGADLITSSAPTIEPGSKEVNLNVSITYEIR